ncbi:putative hydrolase of the HAD superfamily [Gracilibacillus ureilyticus]|uniref:Putative hydrolase of the HAD superfamily n=1 Tax=Gracilibacillus ureilyticus TaxID=531814 RepID=A0A1H9LGK5_9BACI|nr:HAD family hydrolase [Gracilibacillus ureilyticus]SER10063.1 putative hydrolase of the HAD superfamily [Gracilibacillus ureilyticus]
MIKAALFDLDGTLLNRDLSVQRFIETQYDRFSGKLSHISKLQYANRFISLDNKGYVWKDKVYQQLIREFHLTDITWQELLEDYVEQFHHCCVPYPNLLTTLEILKNSNIKIGMISNGKTDFQRRNIEALNISHFFDQIIISEEAGLKKPDPMIFQLALDKLRVKSYESVFVGDHPLNDIEAAQKCGIKGIWIKDSFWSAVRADYEITDLLHIIDIIEKEGTKTIK